MSIKKLVVKVGTSTLTHDTGLPNLHRIDLLAQVLSDLKNQGIEVVLVSSGAIAVGRGKLGVAKSDDTIKKKQAIAAVGQVELMNLYSTMFARYSVSVAQILLTREAVRGDERTQNAINTMETLLTLGLVPIVNENDTISTEEIEFGDNDNLSAYVATLIDADLLVILSDIDGLYDCDPHTNPGACLIERVDKITPEIRQNSGGAGSNRGTGGMQTKLDAVEVAAAKGIDTVIANGTNPAVLYDIIQGKARGTFFCGRRIADNG